MGGEGVSAALEAVGLVKLAAAVVVLVEQTLIRWGDQPAPPLRLQACVCPWASEAAEAFRY